MLPAQSRPIVFTPEECGELLTGAQSLSERAYKSTRKLLLARNVSLATYDATVKYLKSLDVGRVQATGEACAGKTTGEDASEQCFVWDLEDTLKRLMAQEPIVKHLNFPTTEQQTNLFQQLSEKRPDVYNNLDARKRTLFLRQTGDNYRAALKRQKTQQMSFCLLNIKELVSSPLGQHVLACWRGGETHAVLKSHMEADFETLERLCKDGIRLPV